MAGDNREELLQPREQVWQRDVNTVGTNKTRLAQVLRESLTSRCNREYAILQDDSAIATNGNLMFSISRRARKCTRSNVVSKSYTSKHHISINNPFTSTTVGF